MRGSYRGGKSRSSSFRIARRTSCNFPGNLASHRGTVVKYSAAVSEGDCDAPAEGTVKVRQPLSVCRHDLCLAADGGGGYPPPNQLLIWGPARARPRKLGTGRVEAALG